VLRAAALAALALVGAGAAQRNGPLLVTAFRSSPFSDRAYTLQGGRLRLAAQAPFDSAALAPGGKLLALVAGLQQSRLLVVGADGRGRHTIVTAGCMLGTCPLEAAWAPDGKRLAVVVVAGGASLVRIYGAGGRLLADVTPPAADPQTIYGHVTWSPDGAWLGLWRETGDEGTATCCKGDYLIEHPDGTGLKTLLPIREPIHDVPQVSWAPNGRRIAVATDGKDRRDPRFAVVDVPSGKLHRLAVPAFTSTQAWSPGSTLLAAGAPDGRVRVVTTAGRVVRTLAVHLTTPPVWSPDGATIAFGAGTQDVLTVPAGGGPASRVATLPKGWQLTGLQWPRG
jgi:Tol biopolymer transport system component